MIYLLLILFNNLFFNSISVHSPPCRLQSRGSLRYASLEFAANILSNSKDIPRPIQKTFAPRFHGFRLRHCMTREASDLIWRQESNKNIIIRELRQSVWVKRRKSIPIPCLFRSFRKTTEKVPKAFITSKHSFMRIAPQKGDQQTAKKKSLLFIQSLFTLFPRRPKQRNEKERKNRNENNFYLSYVIVCKIIYSRRKFYFIWSCLFHLLFGFPFFFFFLLARSSFLPSSLETNFLKNIYSDPGIDTHTPHCCCCCRFIPSIFVDSFFAFFGAFTMGVWSETRDDSIQVLSGSSWSPCETHKWELYLRPP